MDAVSWYRLDIVSNVPGADDRETLLCSRLRQMPRRDTPPTHYLFLRIFAAVGQSSKRMTVSDLAQVLKTPVKVVAQCIALHLYAQRKPAAQLPLPLPADYWVPSETDVITKKMLQPKQAGRMLAVEQVIRDALMLSA